MAKVKTHERSKRTSFFNFFLPDNTKQRANFRGRPLSQANKIYMNYNYNFLKRDLSLAGNSSHLTWVRLQQPQEQRYPLLTVRAVFSRVQTKIWLPVLGIFNVRTDANARDCTQELYGHRGRVCTES